MIKFGSIRTHITCRKLLHKSYRMGGNHLLRKIKMRKFLLINHAQKFLELQYTNTYYIMKDLFFLDLLIVNKYWTVKTDLGYCKLNPQNKNLGCTSISTCVIIRMNVIWSHDKSCDTHDQSESASKSALTIRITCGTTSDYQNISIADICPHDPEQRKSIMEKAPHCLADLKWVASQHYRSQQVCVYYNPIHIGILEGWSCVLPLNCMFTVTSWLNKLVIFPAIITFHVHTLITMRCSMLGISTCRSNGIYKYGNTQPWPHRV